MRNIPGALYDHLQQDVTTTCRLILFILTSGEQFGCTSHDQDIEYLGIHYIAHNGMDASQIQADAGLSVDNAEGSLLLAYDIDGIDEQRIVAGDLDDARWMLLLVNWADLTMGHILLDAGDVGEVKIKDGMRWEPELISTAMRLKQAIGHYDSRTCRAIFGTPADSQTGCGVDVTALWIPGAVTNVGTEPFRVFAGDVLAMNPDPVPGRLQWLTGNNAAKARLYQVEAYDAGGTIALLEATGYPIVIGDTFQIRRDCDKTPATCTEFDNFINYKGEPLIPVGDGAQILTPSSQLRGGFTGSEIVPPSSSSE